MRRRAPTGAVRRRPASPVRGTPYPHRVPVLPVSGFRLIVPYHPRGYSHSVEELMDADEAGRLINRLRRVEGQSRGLQRMIEEGRPCEEIFMQLAATKAALDRVGVLLISLKMRECLAEEAGGEVASPVAVEKALEAFLKYARCVK